ncbi:tRNA (adenosine(37)-N6)-threonylcarbamoyltransferase complex ATPase subunit type 1 TsaE [Patescibacteria group bacterium]|nr:tRNA (adenosine(37)-N6)-threonylcarbamoyltransferase complex ATPase subunit type 1 TsaE [Patescibacteria group bacterium]MBU1922136.1 tRNA (adenosine(37)-N6)-threonylcarbamoyltransferase complex ATPase subunit type 1 TsaE [Patescibacteria group bacterium]
MKKIINSEKEMYKFASQLAKKLKGGEVLALQGELGAGKTTFVKGLARALGVREVVHSPTFILVKPYRIRNQKIIKTLIHVDAYRVAGGEDLIFVGLDEFFQDKDTVMAIEWAEKVKKILPRARTKWIKFYLGKKLNQRIVQIKD